MNILHFNLQKNWRGGEQQLAYLMEYAQKNNPSCNYDWAVNSK